MLKTVDAILNEVVEKVDPPVGGARKPFFGQKRAGEGILWAQSQDVLTNL
jgi:hypothetical protein